jgi:hypothetical protein
MFWLMIVLLVSLAALLVAVAGLMRHIWLQRGRLLTLPPGKAAPPSPSEETDVVEP